MKVAHMEYEAERMMRNENKQIFGNMNYKELQRMETTYTHLSEEAIAVTRPTAISRVFSEQYLIS